MKKKELELFPIKNKDKDFLKSVEKEIPVKIKHIIELYLTMSKVLVEIDEHNQSGSILIAAKSAENIFNHFIADKGISKDDVLRLLEIYRKYGEKVNE